MPPMLVEKLAADAADKVKNVRVDDCKSTTWTDAEAKISALHEAGAYSVAGLQMHTARINEKLRINPRLSEHDKQTLQKLRHAVTASVDHAAKLKLDIADAAMKAGCLDLAETHYRYVISNYTIEAMAAYRQRAQIGLDDIRLRRGGVLCSWFKRC